MFVMEYKKVRQTSVNNIHALTKIIPEKINMVFGFFCPSICLMTSNQNQKQHPAQSDQCKVFKEARRCLITCYLKVLFVTHYQPAAIFTTRALIRSRASVPKSVCLCDVCGSHDFRKWNLLTWVEHKQPIKLYKINNTTLTMAPYD